MIRKLETELRVPAGLEEVFAFFADPFNLEQLTPPWLRFKILTPRPIEMRPGTLIDYRLSIHGIPVRWQSMITVWDPPHRFVDEQLRGPYSYWCHEHSFREDGSGTLIRDLVHYAAPGRVLEPLIDRFLVRPDVEKIFKYRTERCEEIFAAPGKPLRSGR